MTARRAPVEVGNGCAGIRSWRFEWRCRSQWDSGNCDDATGALGFEQRAAREMQRRNLGFGRELDKEPRTCCNLGKALSRSKRP